MSFAIILGGLTLLIGLAVLIGRIDAHARDAAWRRIAVARAGVQERELALHHHLGTDRCPRCPHDRLPDEA